MSDRDVARLVTVEALRGHDPQETPPAHKVAMVCVDYFAPQRKWVAMCWCGKYKSDRCDSPQEAAQRARMHLRAKPTEAAVEAYHKRARGDA